jgi:hypothetical protein
MINLPSILTEDTHFYQENKEKLKPYLGRPYISYSSVSSWFDYKDDFIKQKFAGIQLPSGIYALMGNYIGEAIEHGYFAENNPNGFIGQENLEFSRYRKEGAEYEKLIVIDMGGYIIVGFIDVYYIENGTVNVEDMKSGGKDKEKSYSSDDYIQTVLYGYAIEQETGKEPKIGVNFIRREGSHVNPPLKIGKEQFYIPNTYSKERIRTALEKVDKAVHEISELYSTYQKYFGKKE